MKTTDRYHKWVEWSEEDGVYIGKCPDLITGIHGDDPLQVYGELCEVVEDVVGCGGRHDVRVARTMEERGRTMGE